MNNTLIRVHHDGVDLLLVVIVEAPGSVKTPLMVCLLVRLATMPTIWQSTILTSWKLRF